MKSIIFPGKYVMGRNILGSVGEYTKSLGTNFLVVASKSVMQIAKDKITASLSGTEMKAEFVLFGGECSYKEIDRLAECGKAAGCNTVIGIGGGKLLDASKAAALKLKSPVVIVPTIASTDASTSALTVVYTEDGVFQDYFWLPANPDVVLVDTEILCKAPVSYLVAGMGDALATYFEARAVRASDSKNCAIAAHGRQTITAFALGELCYKTLLEDGVKAKLAAEAGVVTTAFENICEANILLSGLGFESGGLAAAHSVHNGVTALHQSHGANHGDKVAFGVLTQLVLENAPMEEIHEVLGFCASIGLPVTFAEIGLADITDEELWTWAETTAKEGETIHAMPFEVTAATVYGALKAANALGVSFKANN